MGENGTAKDHEQEFHEVLKKIILTVFRLSRVRSLLGTNPLEMLPPQRVT
ncbi:4182_t:CDS:2 [Paraglomus brasilianum]|uniref:4182_t:CDS:1 n=1 Tax=Paraglomus brasilianum TaxID=144538 RepID=A0A9N9CIV1_9GLOM|nr:4182_t:CDS:2 [Paraglomus brasilianum]